MQTSAHFGEKNSHFSKFMVYPPARTGGGGVNFSRFWADVFYGRLLIQKMKFTSFGVGWKTLLGSVYLSACETRVVFEIFSGVTLLLFVWWGSAPYSIKQV